MGNLVIDMSMSLDGYIAAPNDNPEQGLARRDATPNWAFDDPSVFERVYGNLVEETGAVIMGRRSYDNSIEAWGGKGPLGDVPCFVVTHSPPASADPVFTFVTDGIERLSRTGGGWRQGHRAHGRQRGPAVPRGGPRGRDPIHLVNVLLGGGRRLFDRLPQRIELEQTGLTETDGVTHLTYRVVR